MSVIGNPAGAFGYTDLQSQFYREPSQAIATANIAAKRVVAVGTTGGVATAATDGTASLAIGITQDAISSGKTGIVIVKGLVEDVPVAGAVAAGDILKRSVTTAGYLSATATPAVGEGFAIAINASSSGTADVWIS